MKRLSLWVVSLLGLAGLAGCAAPAEPTGPNVRPVPVVVAPEPAPRAPAEPVVAESLPFGSAAGAAETSAILEALRGLCRQLDTPAADERATAGSEAWKTKFAVDVRDFRLYSPEFRAWTLASVDNPERTSTVRQRGPFFGFGLTVEVENRGDAVVTGDNVWVWATYTFAGGKQVCFARADAERSFDPHANKGAGAFIRERDVPEWPFRPGERKRYTVTETSCPTLLLAELQPSDVTLELYLRFVVPGGDPLVVGPLATLQRKGGLLRGLPLAEAARAVQHTTKKGSEAMTAHYATGDRLLAAAGKTLAWLPVAEFKGFTPDKPPPLAELPAATPEFSRNYGGLAVAIRNWQVSGWRALKGAVALGHRVVEADVSLSIDAAAVQQTLQAALQAAQGRLGEAQKAATAAGQALATAETQAGAAKGSPGEAAAKDAAGAAKAALKAAEKAQKDAEKALKDAEKNLTGGVAAFLKEQAKAIDCGSFRLDVAHGQLKPMKDSFGSKECKALLAGQPAAGRLRFDLQRWDMPFALVWKGPGGEIQVYPVASGTLAKVLAD